MGAPFCCGCEILIWVAGGDRDKKPANAVARFLLSHADGGQAALPLTVCDMNKEQRKRLNLFRREIKVNFLL
jgi:hypothetical protein